MLYLLFKVSVIILIISILAYTLLVIEEKFFLNRNMVVLDNKHLEQEDLEKADVTEFIFQGVKTRAGDEVRLKTKSNKKYEGRVIGITIEDSSIYLIANNNKIKKINIKEIENFEMQTKYGNFF